LGTTYYAGIGTLWNKPVDSSTWRKAAIPQDLSGTVFAGSGAVIDATLFVAFSDSTGTSLGIWSTTNGTTWNRADAAFPADGSELRMILSANNELFAVSSTVATDLNESYAIHHFNGTSFVATSITSDPDIGLPNSVAYANSAYWFTAGGYLLKGTDEVSITKVTGGPGDWTTGSTVATPLAATYGGVCAIGPTGILVSGRNGQLFYYDDGTTWTTSTVTFKDSSSDAFSFSIPTCITIDAVTVLVVGTINVPRSSSDIPPTDGYLEFDVSASFTADLSTNETHSLISDAINFSSSLAGFSVTSMPFFDLGTTKKIFALTDGDGLWSNTYSGTTWGGWGRE
jgi:hypothetical protein